MDEWDFISSWEYDHLQEEPELVGKVGTWSVMCGPKREQPKGDNIETIRRQLDDKIRDVVFSENTGVWLLRHAPGVGKTYTFGQVANDYFTLGQGVVMCAPTVAEAEKLAEATKTWVLRSQSELNCRQLEVEKKDGPLHQHHRGRHRGTDFCRECPYLADCQSTPGRYKHEQKKFQREAANGQIYCATTVAMLGYVAASINDSQHRIVIWTDEDLLPHVARQQPPVSRSEVLEWIEHAKAVGCNEVDMQFMRAIDWHLGKTPSEDCPESPDDHGTGFGSRAISIADADKAKLREIAEDVIRRLGKSSTHQTEKTREDGEPLPVGSWRPATIRICAELILGASWVHIDGQDYRSLIGRSINRQMLALPLNHALLQSDATASPELWQRVWGNTWRGYIDCNPQRAATLNWHVGGIGRTGKAEEKTITKIVNQLAHWTQGHKGQKVGIITYKAWVDQIKKSLRGKRVKVYQLDGDGDGNKANVVIGWYGRHDRGVNTFHELGVSALFLVGPFRLPMSEYQQVTKALLEMGASVPDSKWTKAGRCGPVASNGEYVIQQGNRATISEHPQTAWVADHERAAALTQAIERIRSVDRAAKGMPVASVHLIGVDAIIPHVALPVRYVY